MRARRVGLVAARAGIQCPGLALSRSEEPRRHRLVQWRCASGLTPDGRRNAQRRRNARRLDGVELAHPSGHEEALDNAQNPGIAVQQKQR